MSSQAPQLCLLHRLQNESDSEPRTQDNEVFRTTIYVHAGGASCAIGTIAAGSDATVTLTATTSTVGSATNDVSGQVSVRTAGTGLQGGEDSGGGSLGWLSLLFLALIIRARRSIAWSTPPFFDRLSLSMLSP